MIGLIIAGLPASGKGTQASKLADAYDLVHLDAGASLRREIKQGSDIGREVQAYTSKGELVPDDIMERLLKKKMGENKGRRGILFDGFPRTKEQAIILEKLSQQYQLEVKGMLYLKVDEGTVLERIRKRAAETGRKDDQDPGIVRSRIEEQKEQLEPLLEYYRAQDKLFEVDGNAGVAEVFDAVKSTVEEHRLASA